MKNPLLQTMTIYRICTLIVVLALCNNCLSYFIKPKGTRIAVCCIALRHHKIETMQINMNNYTQLTIDLCAISSNKSLVEAFNISGVENIEELFIINTFGKHKIRLSGKVFDGLEPLKRIKLMFPIKSIEQDTFANLPMLESLLLDNVRLKLKSKIFNNLTNLKNLTLINNDLSPNYSIFKSMKNLRRLSATFNKLRAIHKEMFHGLDNLHFLDLQENGIKIMRKDAFALLPELRSLNLEANNIKQLPETLLRTNIKLTKFRIDHNNITTLPENFLSHLPMLEKVYLQDIELINISASQFKGSTKLKQIFLQENHLQHLPADLFQDQQYLEKLYMDENQLNELPEGLFKTTRNLRILSFSDNKIRSLSRNTFTSLEKLFELRLNKNHLSRLSIDEGFFHNSVWLKKIDLSRNRLKSITINSSYSSSLEYLRIVDVSYNRISVFSNMWKILRLEELNLQNNSITTLSIDDLEFDSPQISINLSNNNISKISQQLKFTQRISFESQIIVDLAKNPITCDQINQTVATMQPTQNKEIILKNNNMTCAETFYDPFKILNTQFKSYCPSNCTCSVQQPNYAIVVKCAGQGRTELPQLPQPLEVNLTFILHVENNSIAELPSLTSSNQTGFDAVVELHARNNSIHHLTIENFSPNLRLLDISNNKLNTLSEPLLNLLNDTEEIELRISGNHWRCECSSPQFLLFVQQNSKQILDADQVSCENGDKLNSITVSDLCKDNIRNILIICFVVIIIGLLVGIAPAMYYKFELQLKIWLFKHNFFRVTEEEIDKHKPYDAFISYSHNDVDFVVKHLIPTLESEPMNFKICWDARDWTPGELIDSQIHKSIESSRRTIILLSKHFLESVWAQMEFRTAYLKSVAEKRARVIVIIYGDIGDIDDLDCELKTYLKMNTYVRWDDRWFWDKLRYAMPHPLRFYG